MIGHSLPSNVKKLEWTDPLCRTPITFSQWYAERIDITAHSHISTVIQADRSRQQGVVDIIVNSSLYDDLISELAIFVQDLTYAGYAVQLDTMSGMSHTALRSHLAGISQLVGAILIGELPVAWFETNGFGDWEEFPHDLFFCDLDGSYTDADADGIYDNHTGNVAPEIWVGRIYARNLIWDSEVRLLKNYFRKNHLYRVDSLSAQDRALSFIDDDWSYWTTCGLDYIYSTVTVVNDMYQTTAQNYRTECTNGYEWIQLCAHSSPWGHTFLYGYSGYAGTVFNYEIFTLEPHALFCNLFACSGTRFVEHNHSAGWYIFQDPYGLLAIGSTKTGSMLEFEDFYYPIGQQNMSVGDAFKTWFTLWGEQSWDWFYGMNILGDPTLKPRSQIARTSATTSQHTQDKPDTRSWTAPQTVAPHVESDAFPKIAVNRNDGRIWVVWESGRSASNGRCDIFGAYYAAGTWSSASAIGPHTYWDYCPAVGIDNQNRPVAVWAGYNEGQYDLYYCVYTGTWSARQLVHTSDPAYDIRPAAIRDNYTQRVWVAWEARRNVNCDIYASYYYNSSWSSPYQITSQTSDERSPHMAIDSLQRPWIVYSRQNTDKSEIWGSYFNGSQWIESGPISGTQQHAYHPACAVDEQGMLWVVWQATENDNVDIFASAYDGSTWLAPVQITTDPAPDLFPALCADKGGNIHLVYQSKVTEDWNIYYICYKDDTWSTPECVADQTGPDISPVIECDNMNEPWVIWQSYSTGNWEIVASHKSGYTVEERPVKRITERFTVYPTVFSQTLSIETPHVCQEVLVYDITGTLITRLVSNKERQIRWTPKNITSGTYFIMMENEHNIVLEKILYLH
jgi:hypothetical protein